MICNCLNNGNNLGVPKIKHVQGNVLRMAIPLTMRTLVKEGDEMIVNDTDFIPSSDHPVWVVFSKGKRNYPIIATMDGNVAIIEDKGKIPVGTYDISVECYDDLGSPYRFKQNAVLYVADTTAEAGIDEEIEYEAQTWYLNAAIFFATTEIGSMTEVINEKINGVFGDVMYDADAGLIKFYNKGKSRLLATLDSRPFTVDGTVADVNIDVSRQILNVVLNADAGSRRFQVPLYTLFSSYYNKRDIDNRLENYYNKSQIDSRLADKASINGDRVQDFTAAAFYLASEDQHDGDAVKIQGYVDHSNDDAVIYFVDLYNYGGTLAYRFPQDDETRHIATEEYVQEYVEEHGGGGGYNVTFDNGNVIFSGSNQPTFDNGNIIF